MKMRCCVRVDETVKKERKKEEGRKGTREQGKIGNRKKKRREREKVMKVTREQGKKQERKGKR